MSDTTKITESLRSEFEENMGIYSDLLKNRDMVSEKVTSMKERYNELVKQNNKPMFLFCLESLFFQYKILNLEMENYHKSLTLIENRIYGEYYKLYNMMVNQCIENNIQIDEDTSKESSETVDSLPIYKDTDPFFKYRLEDIERIHERILLVIDIMCELNKNKKEIANNYRNNVAVGFSLKLFLQTLDYETFLIQDQIQLFVNYIKFYHSSQRTYLEKLAKKIALFSEELNNNVLVNNPEIQDVQVPDESSNISLSCVPILENKEILNIESNISSDNDPCVEVDVDNQSVTTPIQSMLAYEDEDEDEDDEEDEEEMIIENTKEIIEYDDSEPIIFLKKLLEENTIKIMEYNYSMEDLDRIDAFEYKK